MQPGRDTLVGEHLSLVRALAVQVRRQVSDRLDLDDLIGYGTQGLLEAADRFDAGHGVAFVTFAYHRVKGAIYDGLRRMGHLPRAEYARARAAERANEYLQNLADRDAATVAAGGPAAAPSQEDDARALLGALQGVVTSFVTSLDALGEEGRAFADDAAGPEELVLGADARRRLRDALASLAPKERHFIEAHYFGDKTLVEAGAELGLSKSWASRLHARALEQLRDRLAELS